MRSLIDLNPGALEALATEAWSEAADSAHRAGLSTMGVRNGARVLHHPDGGIDMVDDDADQEQAKDR